MKHNTNEEEKVLKEFYDKFKLEMVEFDMEFMIKFLNEGNNKNTLPIGKGILTQLVLSFEHYLSLLLTFYKIKKGSINEEQKDVLKILINMSIDEIFEAVKTREIDPNLFLKSEKILDDIFDGKDNISEKLLAMREGFNKLKH